jgi:hypothetical protein
LALMRYLARFSPLRAVRDLRMFLAQRKPYELWFMMLAIVITGLVLIAFVKDSSIAPEYKPDIIYVQQWSLDRTDAQIRAQQVIDQAEKDKATAAFKVRQEKRQAEFKRLDDKLKSYGF